VSRLEYGVPDRERKISQDCKLKAETKAKTKSEKSELVVLMNGASSHRNPSAPRVIIILGQTGSGKSSLAVQVAQLLGSVIISADAFQVYKEFSVASDKICNEDMGGVNHFGLDLVPPTEEFTVKNYLSCILPVIDTELRAGRSPVVVGGTNMYIEKLLFTSRLDEDDSVHPDRSLPSSCARVDSFEHLAEMDPVMASRLHPNDQRRVLRAIDYFYVTGCRMSEKLRNQSRKLRWPNILVVCKRTGDACAETLDEVETKKRKISVDPFQANLEAKIKRRIEEKMLCGEKLKAELYRIGDLVSAGKLRWNKGILQAIGYREFEPFVTRLCEKGAEDQALFYQGVADLLRDTIQYSKKQKKWIRKLESMIEIFHCSDFECMQNLIMDEKLSSVKDIPRW